MELYEVPTHHVIEFGGKVVVPTESEDFAIMEVKKALIKMCEQFDIYGDDVSKEPDWWLNPDGCFIKLVNEYGMPYEGEE